MAQSQEWREFEKLVARIGAAASPRAAVVKSPDRIRDLTTGRMREVDASIRYKLGTTDILVTVECRKRGCTADGTWIEHLATKRQKIGAAKTIAVSSTGFTGPAIESAKHFGIELRILSEVSPSDIENWFLRGGAVHVFRLIENIRCVVILYEDSEEPSKYAFDLPDVDARAFHHKKHKSPFPIRDYIPILERTHPEMFANVPFDGKKVEIEFPIEWEFGDLHIELSKTSTGPRFLKSVYRTKLIATVSYQSAVCDIETGLHHHYTSPEGINIQHTSFNTELLGLLVTFEHQSDPSGEQKVSCKFSQKEKRKD